MVALNASDRHNSITPLLSHLRHQELQLAHLDHTAMMKDSCIDSVSLAPHESCSTVWRAGLTHLVTRQLHATQIVPLDPDFCPFGQP